jgi:2-polyprenyl-3-methyl-5-hydroxy-6-metoxy-1,4-benzoquinol methylase
MESPEPKDYHYRDAAPAHTHAYLVGVVEAALKELGARGLFDLGCGNGSFANYLSERYEVVGVDYSESGIAIARQAFPSLRLEHGSAYDDLASKYGQFDAVLSLEVVEHLFDPRAFAARMFALVRPGGGIILSTPYHGYWKNLALALSGKLDAHFSALWDGGHIKFWSMRTLRLLLEEAGFVNIRFERTGRLPPFAKSMVAIARRPL